MVERILFLPPYYLRQLVVPVVNVINVIIKSTATEEAPKEGGEVLCLMSTYHILSVRAKMGKDS